MRQWWRRLPLWNAQRRRRQVLDEARARQDMERRAAYARIERLADQVDEPTAVHPIVRPLLTRGQAARSKP